MCRLHVDFGLAEMQTEKHMKKMAPTYLSKSELESLETGLAGVLLQWIGEDDAATGQDPPGLTHTHEHVYGLTSMLLPVGTCTHTHLHTFTRLNTCRREKRVEGTLAFASLVNKCLGFRAEGTLAFASLAFLRFSRLPPLLSAPYERTPRGRLRSLLFPL